MYILLDSNQYYSQGKKEDTMALSVSCLVLLTFIGLAFCSSNEENTLSPIVISKSNASLHGKLDLSSLLAYANWQGEGSNKGHNVIQECN